MYWTLFALGFIPIIIGILTIAGLWIPGLRCYPGNSHKRPKEPLSTAETIGLGVFMIAFGALMICCSLVDK